MKNLTAKFAMLIAVLAFVFTSCEGPITNGPEGIYPMGFGYNQYLDIELVSAGESDGNGNYIWIWKISQNKTGQGYPGLSHFDISTPCDLDPDYFGELIVGAYWSTDGSNWSDLNDYNGEDKFVYDFDNSCDASSGPVWKFDVAQGNENYYKLVLSKQFQVVPNAVMYLKTGKQGDNTFCTMIEFDGIGCELTNPPNCYFEGSETAWGEGTRFTNQGNWGMYFTFSGTEVVKNLYAGQTTLVGTVKAYLENGYIVVEYNFNDPYWAMEYHMHIGSTVANIPQTRTKNPVPGQFAYKYAYAGDEDDPYVQTIKIVSNFAYTSGTVYIAAHAVVTEQICE